MNKKFIPVMLTPFKANGEVDYDGLTQLTEYYLKAGAQGLFANCLSSEMYELTETERIQVVKHVVKVANGSVPVVATGTFQGTLNEQAEFVKRIYDVGTQAVIIITGVMATQHEDDPTFNQRIFDLLDLTDNIPVGFYECPVPYKRVVSADQLKLFADTGRVIYHKDTCLDLMQVKAKIKAGSGRNFGLYDAFMVNAVKSLQAGAAGLSCIQGNYFADLVVWICENYDNADQCAEVEKVMDFFVNNMELMHDVYPQSAKYCLQQQGLNITTTIRTKSKAFSPDVKSGIDKLFNKYLLLQKELQLEVVTSSM
ncbi:dihydrodipicolinate synthase family protein [Segetibacter sp.]|jgi:4-hydroxy-tetrahydrodipicolinate synthase|uniref:dihydrodipicolinate synthase family protein n=1 Tax=Segetibacter sp. TaxID=2231182 RepID=UPI0026302BD8|nr:dihydrodipicolinate synthase family protein [Segetibacter sp.]MCW3082388.1 dihydrodipicolinate synthetase [Segetibacter sp.]